MGIKNVRHGQSWHAPIIEIPAEDEEKANELLFEKWGKKTFGHNPRGKTMLDDIEDDDPRFYNWHTHL